MKIVKFAVIPNMTRKNAFGVTEKFLNAIKDLNCKALLEEKNKDAFGEKSFAEYGNLDFVLENCDTVISIGGDGTFINAAKLSVKYKKPLICVNAGKLAYLACLEADEAQLLKNVVDGDFTTEKRMMLEAAVVDKNGKILYHSNCVNDAVVSRSGSIRIMKLDVSCNGEPLIQYMADGVIVSTPTGSTAYSLSAGGPVIEPGVESMMLTPVCCHSVFSRSVVLKDSSFLEIKHDNSGESILSCDGESAVQIPVDAVVTVKRSEDTAEFIKINNYTFIDVLRKKIST